MKEKINIEQECEIEKGITRVDMREYINAVIK